jgi:hypothetical protein
MSGWTRLLAGSLLLAGSFAQAAGPREIDWLELMPPEDLKAIESMGEIDHSGGVDLESALTSARTVAAVDGIKGRLPGYVVPVSFDDQGRITELFLVPYFGACIHMPPPPPNQIIYIKPSKPVAAGEIWDAYWAIGTLRIASTRNDMAHSAYSMDLEKLEIISE